MSKFERLKEARIRKGLTQDGVAKLVPCSRHTYRKWESDREPKSLDMAVKVCAIVGINLHYYMTGEVLDKLTKNEAMLVSWFRSLNDEEKSAVELLVDRREPTSKKSL